MSERLRLTDKNKAEQRIIKSIHDKWQNTVRLKEYFLYLIENMTEDFYAAC